MTVRSNIQWIVHVCFVWIFSGHFYLYSCVTAYIRDATGASTSVKGIRLNFCDVNWQPPQTMVARKMLTDIVTSAQSTKTKTIQLDGKIDIFHVINIIFRICSDSSKLMFYPQQIKLSLRYQHRSHGLNNGAKYSYQFSHNLIMNSPDISLAAWLCCHRVIRIHLKQLKR